MSIPKTSHTLYPKRWLLSTGVPNSVCNDKRRFQNYKPLKPNQTPKLVDAFGGIVPILGIGDVLIKIYNSYNESLEILVKGVFHIIGQENILQLHYLLSKGVGFKYSNDPNSSTNKNSNGNGNDTKGNDMAMLFSMNGYNFLSVPPNPKNKLFYFYEEGCDFYDNIPEGVHQINTLFIADSDQDGDEDDDLFSFNETEN